MSSKMKRTKIEFKQPNPLFEKWLQEWRDEAAARGSDMQYCFGKALSSVRKYPLPLKTGRDCAILQNFGNRLCVMLDRKLVEYRKQHPEQSNAVSSDGKYGNLPQVTESTESKLSPQSKRGCNVGKKQQSSVGSKQKRRTSEYVPTYRSGPYAILVSLLQASIMEGYPGFIDKNELQKLAQPLCDTSFTKPVAGSYYTAWSSMSSLIKKGLVSSVGRCKYSLTAEGESLAQKLQNIETNDECDGLPGTVPKQSTESCAVTACSNTERQCEVPSAIIPTIGRKKAEISEENTNILAPCSFDIILLVDTHETSGVSGKKENCDPLLNDLNQQNVLFEVRHLKIGDFAWICRERSNGVELVLPYIIERKRIDDFAQSIMDGRFREQKFRLKQCGIPNLMYLVEKHGKESHTALPLETLNQAAANTEVTDGFIVKYTGNQRESATYLAHFTHFLTSLFMSKTLVMCSQGDVPSFSVNDDIAYLMSFQEFNKSSMKNKTLKIREMFIKHLVQLNGLSVEKALAIVERYPTPYSLYKMFENGGDAKFLSDFSFGSQSRRIGPVLSKSVYNLYNNSSLA